MKELGEKLLNKRIEMGITTKEVSEDLNYSKQQLDAIENGDFKNFKDIFLLKCIITDYAKYLGFNADDIIDEFNEYVFESTSKIPIAEIEKASKLKEKKQDDKIISPYTMEEPKNNKTILILVISIFVLIIAAVCIIVYNSNVSSDDNNLKVSYIEE